jgi:phosphoribosylformimino-5-aminoimidazole carboxamide ribotide isomerase
MIILPAIDLRHGKVVRLLKGDFAQETQYSDNPLEMAKKWADEGAQMLHVVDLDGALDGRPSNLDIIGKIARTINIPIEVGGGIRTLDDIKLVLDSGAKRVILSTAACENQVLLKKAIEAYKDAIAIGIDAKNGIVMKRGWVKSAGIEAIKLTLELQEIGVKRVIYTNIEADGTLAGVRFENIREFVEKTNVLVTASGGVSSIDDIKQLKTLEKQGLEAAIIGKALYDKRLDLKEAIEASR